MKPVIHDYELLLPHVDVDNLPDAPAEPRTVETTIGDELHRQAGRAVLRIYFDHGKASDFEGFDVIQCLAEPPGRPLDVPEINQTELSIHCVYLRARLLRHLRDYHRRITTEAT